MPSRLFFKSTIPWCTCISATLCTRLFGAARVGTPVAALIGETHAASASFELAALLSRAEDDASCAGRTAVITSVDPGGTAAAALLRLRPDR